MHGRKPGGKKSGGSTSKEHAWDDLGKAQRQSKSSLPNRLELSLDWWAKQSKFEAGKGYAESDPHVYRFAAKALDAAGYQFLQIDRTHGQKTVVDRYGGLVDQTSRKRSFAIEPGYRQGQLTGQEQRNHQGHFGGATFPDLVVKKPSSDKPVGIELKVAKRYGTDAPVQSLKNLFEGTYGGDRYFQNEFNRRATVTPTHERRLLVDVNTSGLSKRDALEYFRSEHGSHGGQFNFDTLQFIHRKGGKLKLSSAYQTADGFSKEGKTREGNFNSSRSSLVGRGSITNAFAQVTPRQNAPIQSPGSHISTTTTTTSFPSFQPLAPGPFLPPSTQPVLSPPSSPSHGDSNDRKRKRVSSVGSDDSLPSTPVQPYQAPTSPRREPSGPEKKKAKLVLPQDASRHASPARSTPPSSPRHSWSGDDASPPSSPRVQPVSNLQGPLTPSLPAISPAPVRRKPPGTTLKTKKDGTPDKRSSGYRKQEENKKAAKGTNSLFGYFKQNPGPGPGPGPGSGQGGGITVRK